MSTKTLYKVIGFGTNEHGFWNEPTFCSTLSYAVDIFNAHKEDPEMDGAVIIKCNHEDWEVIDEFGTDHGHYSIVCGPLFTHKVSKAPALVMV